MHKFFVIAYQSQETTDVNHISWSRLTTIVSIFDGSTETPSLLITCPRNATCSIQNSRLLNLPYSWWLLSVWRAICMSLVLVDTKIVKSWNMGVEDEAWVQNKKKARQGTILTTSTCPMTLPKHVMTRFETLDILI